MEALCVSVCGWIHFISSSAPMIVPLPESSSLHSLLVHTKQDNFEFFSSPFCGELFPPGCSLALYPLKRLWHYIGFCATLFCVCNNVEQLCSWFIQFESEAQKWRCGAQGTTWEHYSRTKNDSFECHSNVEEARVVCIAHCASDAIEQLHLLETLFILFLPFSSSSSACTVSIHRQWWKLNIAGDFTMTDECAAHFRWSIVLIKLPNASSQKSQSYRIPSTKLQWHQIAFDRNIASSRQ